MYAFVSNEYKGIVYTQRQLDKLLGIFTYPEFKKVSTMEEADSYFLLKNRQQIESQHIYKYGKREGVDSLSIRVEYFIDDNSIYANLDTSKCGFIKFGELPDNVTQDATYDLIRLKIRNVNLDDRLIAHHCAAIQYIVRLIDPIISLEVELPDISVYLALTKYTGKNYVIKRTQSIIQKRYSPVCYTIK